MICLLVKLINALISFEKNPSFPETDQLLILVIKLKRHLSLVKKDNKQADQIYQQKIVNTRNHPLLEFNSPNIKTVNRVIQQKSDEEQETDQEVSQVKDYESDKERETDEHEDDQEASQVKYCGHKRKTIQNYIIIKSKKKSLK
ncbi:unnamed protein product [Rhizophagus irregularis]|nr:unnamed protein product [Rhizophagus irregularis]